MFKHYLFSTLRILYRNRLYTLLNIVGLATGIATCLMILQYVRFEKSYENMHSQADQIVRLTLDYYEGESMVEQDAGTYIPLGPRVVREIPEANQFARFQYLEVQEFVYGNKIYKENKAYYASAASLDLFDYHFIEGDKGTALQAPYEMLISESIARKYFGKEEALGKILTWNYGDELVKIKVVGVIEDIPQNTHLKFDMLVSYKTGFAVHEKYEENWEWKEDNWNSNNDFTYIRLNAPEDLPNFKQKLLELNHRLHAEGQMENEFAIAQPIKDIHLYSHKPYEAEPNGDAQSVYFLRLIALFILIMAGVNYVNMATARSMERAKEVGIRKTIGSRRNQLIRQFLFETALIHVFAGTLALSLIQLFQPAFESMTGIETAELLVHQPIFWIQFLGLLLLSTLISGLYPAWFLSAYQPSRMLKRAFSHSGEGNLLRKGLIVAQFSISLMLIVGALVLRAQLIYMKNKPLGTNIDQTLVLSAPRLDSLQIHYPSFRQSLQQSPYIDGVAVSSIVPGISIMEMSTTTGIRLHGSQKENNLAFYMLWIDEGFLPQMEIEILAGENFLPDSRGEKIVVNEKALSIWDIQSPQQAIGVKVDYWGTSWTIMGVVKDFHQHSVKEPYIPMIMMYSNGFWGYASIKSSTPDTRRFVQTIRANWDSHFSGSAFSFFFLDEHFNKQYISDNRFLKVFNYLTGLAILIAALGLIGLSAYMSLKRRKEIGIRKVLGAGIAQIWALLSKDFFGLLIIAAGIGIPLAYVGISYWLNKFPFQVDLKGTMFLLPVIILFILAGSSISYQILRAARVNPVETLKNE